VPKADWGIDPGVVDDYDRESQYAPYKGPKVPDGVYRFKVRDVKFAAATKKKLPQLRPWLELVPRSDEERRFKSYTITAFLPVSDRTEFRYVPFLDAIGVTGAEFTGKTVVDEDGKIKKIGKWRNDGETEILAQLRTKPDNEGAMRQEVAWMGPYDPDDDDYDTDDEDDDYEEEEDTDD
jgi:hypothetical protein